MGGLMRALGVLLGELALDAVQVEVDLPFVVPAEFDPEYDVVNLAGPNRRVDTLAVECGFDAVEETVDFFHLVSTPE
jgi:hypothetical protein